ncbi:MAG: ROK family transcriptional regulator [Spirochaetaceae bacterium]|nr:MAG: ROK family transcriptional regulator [Spirochaetaceae bacterium]
MKTVSFQSAANPNVQNRINVSLIFNYLRHWGPAYRAHIARDLGLSPPAVSRAVENLVGSGYVLQSGTVTTGSGKKAPLYQINRGKGCVVAIDLFKEHMRIAAVDFSGQVLRKSLGSRYAESDDIQGDVIRDVDRFLAESSDVDLPAVAALCLGVPAAIDRRTGRVTGAYLYNTLKNLDLVPVLSERYGVDVYVENDVKLAALAENRLGEGKEHRNLIYLDISDGIAAGIIVDNQILRGADGFAGEVGFMVPSTENLEYSTFTRGYLENVASVEAVRIQAVQAIQRGARSSLLESAQDDTDRISARMVFEAATAGDQLATNVINRAVDLITLAIFNLVLVLNPEIVVLGGDIYEMPGVRPLILDPIRARFSTMVPFTPPDITLSSLGNDLCLLGASLLGVDNCLNREYPFQIDNESALAGGRRQLADIGMYPG